MWQEVLAAVIAGLILGILGLIGKIILILIGQGHLSLRLFGQFLSRTILVIAVGLVVAFVYGFVYWRLIDSTIGGRLYFVFWAVLGIVTSTLWSAFRWKEGKTETTPKLLESWVGEKAERIKQNLPLTFNFRNIEMICYYDESANRMRIMAPITSIGQTSPEVLRALLDAHATQVLDAHYAIHESCLFAIFLHPLRSLTKEDFVSALNQVANLVETFGATPRGGELEFVGFK